MDEIIRQPIFFLASFMIGNLVMALIIKKKSVDHSYKENAFENKKGKKRGAKLFSFMIIPTIILIFLLADTFVEFLLIYLYFLGMVVIADRI